MQHASPNIVAGDFTMTVNANNDLAPRHSQRSIQASGHDLFGIINQRHIRMFAAHVRYNFASAIGRHAVRDDHFQTIARIILRNDRAETASNERAFISNRHQNRNEWCVLHQRVPWLFINARINSCNCRRRFSIGNCSRMRFLSDARVRSEQFSAV